MFVRYPEIMESELTERGSVEFAMPESTFNDSKDFGVDKSRAGQRLMATRRGSIHENGVSCNGTAGHRFSVWCACIHRDQNRADSSPHEWFGSGR
jgi:hypothetical protein